MRERRMQVSFRSSSALKGLEILLRHKWRGIDTLAREVCFFFVLA